MKFRPVAFSMTLVSRLILPRQEQFGHHEVGQQNVRRVICDPPPLLLAFLTGVAPHNRLKLTGQAGLGDELLDLVDLAVGQCVHRIDDDRARSARPPGFPRANDRIDYRHEKAKRLARTGSGCNHIALARPSLCDGLRLMAIEPQGRWPEPENLASRFVEITRSDQIINRRALEDIEG